MGRIKTKKIKRVSEDIVRDHGDKLNADYEHNKQLIDGMATIPSKKLRNIIAGYVTRIKKTRKDI